MGGYGWRMLQRAHIGFRRAFISRVARASSSVSPGIPTMLKILTGMPWRFRHSIALSTSSRPNCRSEEHTSELQSLRHLVCRLLLEKKKKNTKKKVYNKNLNRNTKIST